MFCSYIYNEALKDVHNVLNHIMRSRSTSVFKYPGLDEIIFERTSNFGYLSTTVIVFTGGVGVVVIVFLVVTCVVATHLIGVTVVVAPDMFTQDYCKLTGSDGESSDIFIIPGCVILLPGDVTLLPGGVTQLMGGEKGGIE